MSDECAKIIRLKVHEISKINVRGDQYLMILQEASGKRKMPILLNKREAEDLLFAANRDPKFHAPWSQVIKNLSQQFGFIVEGIILYELRDSRYIAQVQLSQNGNDIRMEMDGIHAIILALTFRCPIFIDEELFKCQYSRPDAQGSLALPIDTLSISMLQEALHDAIREENYELASHIRDEINRRK